EHDIPWQDELWRTVPTSTVEDQQGDGADADAFADFGQMLVHGVDTDDRHDQGGTGPARRADGAEQIALRWPFQQASPAGTFGQLRPGVNRRSRRMRGRVPRLAQMRVGVPCWPTRAQ